MDFKIVKLPHNDFNLILKKHLMELEANDNSFNIYKTLIYQNNKNAFMAFKDNNKIGYMLYKTDLFNITITSIYVDPIYRGYGYEEVMIKAIHNYFSKAISVLVRNNDNYLRDIFRKLGYYTIKSTNKKLGQYFEVYTKDFYKSIPYTKIIMNVDLLYDNDLKEYNTAKKIFKAYGLKPKKTDLLTYLRSIDSVIDDYNNSKLTDEEFYNEKYQRYLKKLNIKIDPLLCLRINNSCKTKYRKGMKEFLKTVGKHKHIIILSTIDSDSLKVIKSNLKFPNISKYFEAKSIDYLTIKGIIDKLRYRNIEEICLITNDNLDDEILKSQIDTISLKYKKNNQDNFLFTKISSSIKDISKYIRKK